MQEMFCNFNKKCMWHLGLSLIGRTEITRNDRIFSSLHAPREVTLNLYFRFFHKKINLTVFLIRMIFCLLPNLRAH